MRFWIKDSLKVHYFIKIILFQKKIQNYSEKDFDIFQNTLQCDSDIFLVPHMSQFYHVFYSPTNVFVGAGGGLARRNKSFSK